MAISGVGVQPSVDAQYDVTVAKKAQDSVKESGQRALELIQSAAAPPPVKPGHSLSVFA
jgi:hypothetical protein